MTTYLSCLALTLTRIGQVLHVAATSVSTLLRLTSEREDRILATIRRHEKEIARLNLELTEIHDLDSDLKNVLGSLNYGGREVEALVARMES